MMVTIVETCCSYDSIRKDLFRDRLIPVCGSPCQRLFYYQPQLILICHCSQCRRKTKRQPLQNLKRVGQFYQTNSKVPESFVVQKCGYQASKSILLIRPDCSRSQVLIFDLLPGQIYYFCLFIIFKKLFYLTNDAISN